MPMPPSIFQFIDMKSIDAGCNKIFRCAIHRIEKLVSVLSLLSSSKRRVERGLCEQTKFSVMPILPWVCLKSFFFDEAKISLVISNSTNNRLFLIWSRDNYTFLISLGDGFTSIESLIMSWVSIFSHRFNLRKGCSFSSQKLPNHSSADLHKEIKKQKTGFSDILKLLNNILTSHFFFFFDASPYRIKPRPLCKQTKEVIYLWRNQIYSYYKKHSPGKYKLLFDRGEGSLRN